MAHGLGKSLFVPGKNAKRARKKHNVVEAVLVPVASTALLTTAAIKSLTDHDGNGNGNGNGNSRTDPARPRPASAPEQPSFLDKIAAKAPFLKPVAAVQRRYGEVGGNQLAMAMHLPHEREQPALAHAVCVL